MSAQMTQWREHIASVLEPALGLRLAPGKLDAGVERQRIGCIFPDASQEYPDDVNQELLTVIVRVFLPLKTQRSPLTPSHKPGPLEELAERIATTWRSHVTDQGVGVWFSRRAGVEFDLDANMVEATFIAYAPNLSIVEG